MQIWSLQPTEPNHEQERPVQRAGHEAPAATATQHREQYQSRDQRRAGAKGAFDGADAPVHPTAIPARPRIARLEDRYVLALFIAAARARRKVRDGYQTRNDERAANHPIRARILVTCGMLSCGFQATPATIASR